MAKITPKDKTTMSQEANVRPTAKLERVNGLSSIRSNIRSAQGEMLAGDVLMEILRSLHRIEESLEDLRQNQVTYG